MMQWGQLARGVGMAVGLGLTLGYTASVATAQGAPSTPAGSPAPVAAPPQAAPSADTDASACLARLRGGAAANGLSVADFDRYTSGSALLPTTAAAAKAQPEVQETWWDYIAKTVDDQRVNDGKAVMNASAQALATIDNTYQVDSEPLVAIFGIETNYGTLLGKVDVLNAWLTRACIEQKPLWVKNVYASVRMLRDGDVTRDSFLGSWSGAFGMTQFIPTSYFELGADGDGDGRVDLYHSLPDALASTANHLIKRKAHWVRGVPAVIEVRVPPAIAAGIPPDTDADFLNDDDRRSLAQWSGAGVTRADGSALGTLGMPVPQQSVQASLFAPSGVHGPIFLVTDNFGAIRHYNQSLKYALSVGLLVNRLKGEPGLITAWPTDDPGLSRAQIKELQSLLAAHGYDVGTPDGIPGSKTMAAAAAEKQRRGWPDDGRLGQRILAALRQPGPQ
jgi:lytic murein transglycosylase